MIFSVEATASIGVWIGMGPSLGPMLAVPVATTAPLESNPCSTTVWAWPRADASPTHTFTRTWGLAKVIESVGQTCCCAGNASKLAPGPMPIGGVVGGGVGGL